MDEKLSQRRRKRTAVYIMELGRVIYLWKWLVIFSLMECLFIGSEHYFWKKKHLAW